MFFQFWSAADLGLSSWLSLMQIAQNINKAKNTGLDSIKWDF